VNESFGKTPKSLRRVCPTGKSVQSLRVPLLTRAKKPSDSLAAKNSFLELIQIDRSRPSTGAKYFYLRKTEIVHMSLRPAPIRGAFRDRHERWRRDAMDEGGIF
jgi:hypothetical protein